jgi:hypothetical protein
LVTMSPLIIVVTFVSRAYSCRGVYLHIAMADEGVASHRELADDMARHAVEEVQSVLLTGVGGGYNLTVHPAQNYSVPRGEPEKARKWVPCLVHMVSRGNPWDVALIAINRPSGIWPRSVSGASKISAHFLGRRLYLR